MVFVKELLKIKNIVMKRSMQMAFGMLLNALTFFTMTGQTVTSSHYTIEAVNDSLIFRYPNPAPRHKLLYSFRVTSEDQDEIIQVQSKNLHTLSVSIRNVSDKLIQSPYLLGPEGYDFRDMDKLAAKITEGAETELEKFFRLHQWFSYHYDRYETKDTKYPGFDYDSFFGNPLHVLNQYGGSMCGDAVHVLNSILWRIPPVGSMYGRRVQMHEHQTGEAWFEGAWHNFDASPEIRWVYFDYDNKTIIPFWKDLIKDGGELIKRIKPMTGWDIWDDYSKEASGKQYYIVNKEEGTQWNYNFKLKPGEEFTMYYDMRGRTDQVSRNYNRSKYNIQNPVDYRNPCDYASAVFTYKPDFTTDLHKKFVVEETNIKWTKKGLIAKNENKPASIVFASKSTWGMVGAEITADFFKDGKVYFAVTERVKDTSYNKSLKWIPLRESSVFESEVTGIEGRMTYWVKFEFNGENAGLKSASISTEVQINKYSIPVLKYGPNKIHFSSGNMNGGEAEITYTYDDQSKYDFYEPATEDYGTWVFYRVGGNHTATWTKPLFYRNVKNNPDTLMHIKVEIYKAFGKKAGKLVRLLKDELMPLGSYWWYWNGRDDSGKRCEPGMYSFKVTGHVGESDLYKGNQYGERLYLFSNGVWPVPNEIIDTDN